MTLIQLRKAIEQDDGKSVITQAKSLLNAKNQTNQEDLVTALVVALCKEQQFDEAIKLTDQYPSNHALLYPRAYALYKTKRLDECRQLLSSSTSEANNHLSAQVNYRDGKFDEAATIYKSKFKSNQISSDPELAANILTCLIACGDLAAQKSFIEQHDLINNPPTYELLFNAACSLIEAGDLAGAESALSRAHKMATTTLQSDQLSSEEIADELSVIKCQQAFIKQILGHSAAALDIYTEILHSHVSDPSVRAVASNNSLCVHSSESRVFDSLKRSNKAAHTLNVDEDKLTPKQKVALAFNRVIALVAAKQWANANQQIETLEQLTDDSTNELCTLARAAIAQASKSGDARSILESFVKSHPQQSVESQLVLAHLDLVAGKAKDAQIRLSSISASESQLRHSSVIVDTNNKIDFQHRPAVVAALCALDDKLNQTTQAAERVDDVVNQWRVVLKQSDSARRVYTGLLERASDWNLEHQRGDQASALLKQLASEGQSSLQSSKVAADQLESIAKLVIATAKADPKAAALLASKLPVPAGASTLDVAALETAALPEMTKKKRTNDESTTQSSQSVKQKKKRKRAPRYPKGFDPNNPSNPPVDPQRWLPKWERTNVKGKKKTNKNPMRGAQGSTSAAATPVSTTPTSSTPAVPVVSAAAKKSAAKRKGK